MLGKRGQPTVRRTTSMTEFTLEVGSMEAAPPMIGGEFGLMLSPRDFRRFSGDSHVQTADFLRSCGLCNRPLVPGRDIYMYRGDAAFCSLECREQQMKQDERTEMRAATKNGESRHSELKAAAPEAETVAAA